METGLEQLLDALCADTSWVLRADEESNYFFTPEKKHTAWKLDQTKEEADRFSYYLDRHSHLTLVDADIGEFGENGQQLALAVREALPRLREHYTGLMHERLERAAKGSTEIEPIARMGAFAFSAASVVGLIVCGDKVVGIDPSYMLMPSFISFFATYAAGNRLVDHFYRKELFAEGKAAYDDVITPILAGFRKEVERKYEKLPA